MTSTPTASTAQSIRALSLRSGKGSCSSRVAKRALQLGLGVGLLLASADAHAATVVADDVNLSNADNHNIVIVIQGTETESFPYEEAYGPGNFWTKFDILQNDDDTFSFRLNSKYLSASGDGSVSLSSSQGAAESFELLESDSDSYLIKSWRDTYLTVTGDAWNDLGQTYSVSDEARWYFFDPIDPGSESLQDGIISGSVVKNPFIVILGSEIETFPHQDAYGPFSYWTNWDMIDNGNGTVSFKLNNKYLTTDPSTGVSTLAAWSANAEYTLESDSQLSYHLRTSSGKYLETQGTGWVAPGVANSPSDSTRWNFFQPVAVNVPEPAFDMIVGFESNVSEDWSSVSLASSLSAPVIFADMQTAKGMDTAGLRIDAVDGSGFEVFVEEETSQDDELTHSGETIGYLGIAEGVVFDADGHAIGEVGSVSMSQADHDAWSTMNELVLSYQSPVVRMMMNTHNGADPAHIRLRKVKSDSFQYQVEEWEYLDGGHVRETIAFIIVEAGVHELPNGYMLQAQTASVDENVETVSFLEAYNEAPLVLSQSQTEDGGDAIVTRQTSIDDDSVNLWLQEMEAENGTHSNETIGIISIGG